MRIDTTPRGPIRIGLTPLIDVVFILLVFFMLATSYLDWSGITIDAPVVVEEQADDEAIVVRVSRDGGLELAGTRLSMRELEESLTLLFANAPDRRIAVEPHPEAPLQYVVDALDRIAAAGGGSASLARGPGGQR
ncbi:MAG: biopolymer transporter ExbD [bacterium]|nr:biopolymer transporter ExbD [bacterium]